MGGTQCVASMQTLKPKLIKVLVVLACSALMLTVVFSRVDFARLGGALARVKPVWLLGAFVMFFAGLLSGALRWSAALRAGEVPVRPAPLLRASLAGHFFNLILLSPALGDVAKSALFARWHGARAGVIYATTLLDRAFSVGGSAVFVVIVFALILHGPAMESLRPAGGLHQPWLAAGAGLGLLVAVLLWRSLPGLRSMAFLLADRLRKSLRQLRRRPALAVAGCAAGLMGQVCNTAIMPLCLAAVAGVSLAWGEILWAFPIIAMVAVLPVTIGGAGVRAGAAMLLLVPFGIPAEDIVAAGLLTFGVYAGWALAGLAVGWREELAFLRAREGSRDLADEVSPVDLN